MSAQIKDVGDVLQTILTGLRAAVSIVGLKTPYPNVVIDCGTVSIRFDLENEDGAGIINAMYNYCFTARAGYKASYSSEFDLPLAIKLGIKDPIPIYQMPDKYESAMGEVLHDIRWGLHYVDEGQWIYKAPSNEKMSIGKTDSSFFMLSYQCDELLLDPASTLSKFNTAIDNFTHKKPSRVNIVHTSAIPCVVCGKDTCGTSGVLYTEYKPPLFICYNCPAPTPYKTKEQLFLNSLGE